MYRFLLAAIFCGLFSIIGSGAYAHDAMHPDLDAFFGGMKDSRGNLCCSMTDCHVANAEIRNGEWWAELSHPKGADEHGRTIWVPEPGNWVKIPEDKVLKEHNPTGEPIFCHVVQWKDGRMDPSATIRCFLPIDLT